MFGAAFGENTEFEAPGVGLPSELELGAGVFISQSIEKSLL